ncbi:MAG TPA: tetratricopeptide repeat protein, partial [bacterium (Candidatus Stahlbacteria)]|nr:tetratricopeptide repeat protein [Candidatus Stahlbacteria bacterium]
MFDYITQFLIEAAVRLGPIVLLIEDIHLAGKESSELLGWLARNIREAKLLVCVTYRSEELIGKLRLREVGFEEEVHPLIAMSEAEKKNIQEVELKRLNFQNTEAIIYSMLGVSEFEPKATQWIFERTDGNPLFIQAMLDSFVKDGVVAYEDRQWKVNLPKLITAKVPEQVERIIRVRLGGLPADTLERLATAAVIGKVFSLDIMRELRKWSSGEIYDTIKHGIREALIQETRAQGRLMYNFTHPLIRELLYGEVDPVVRTELHQKIGELLEKYYDKELESAVEQLAYHYSNGKAKNKAIKYFLRAANKTKKEYAANKAIEYYEQAIELVAPGLTEKHVAPGFIPGKVSLAKALEELADIYTVVGSYEKAVKTYDDAIRLMTVPQEKGRTARKLGYVYERIGKYDKAIELYEQGISLIDKEESAELSTLYERMGWTYYLKGDYDKTVELCEKSLNIAERGNFLAEQALALNALANVYRIKADYEKAKDYFERSTEIREQLGDPYDLIGSYNNLGILYENVGEWNRAIQYYQQAFSLAKKISDIDDEARIYNNLGISW